MQAAAQVPVLMYHAHPTMGFSHESYSEQAAFLSQNSYHTITPDELAAWIQNDEPLPIRPIVLTIDDNYIMVYTVAYPIMKQYGLCAVNFTHTHYVGVITGSGDHCDWIEIKEMEDNGAILTESHTIMHLRLTSLNEQSLNMEVAGSKSAIESNVAGKTCRHIAYPYGDYNAAVIQACRDAGYVSAYTTNPGLNYRTTPIFEIKRFAAGGEALSVFKDKIGFNNLAPAPPGDGWTIDNKDPNFTSYHTNWTPQKTPSDFYGSDFLLHAAGDGTHRVRWAAYLPEDGFYNVYAWWVSDVNRSQHAPYEIHHMNGSATVRVDQRVNGGKWNRLGTFQFSSQIAAMVFLSEQADGAVAADGIWFEPTTSGVLGWQLY